MTLVDFLLLVITTFTSGFAAGAFAVWKHYDEKIVKEDAQ